MYVDTNEAIKRIRAGLKARSGKAWSVTNGTGTAWGWLTISSPPRRRTADWDGTGTGNRMTMDDRVELAALLGLGQPVHPQGISVPSGGDYHAEYVQRAEGTPVTRYGQQYWD